MKFFARINDKQVGPLSLTELVEAGVRPSDYIWHKGMADWERADEVPEVCRAMRRYLAGYDPETGELRRPADAAYADGESIKDVPEETDAEALKKIWLRSLPEPNVAPDFDRKPTGVSVVWAILATILCFPLTGVAAIWFAMQCNARWRMSCQEGMQREQVLELRRKAHNDARLYRMLLGITLCMGVMMVGFALFRP